MSAHKVLIVENETLIAGKLKRYLKQNGFDITGIAISYSEATQLFEATTPDIVLLDIRLNGLENAIEVAKFINKHPSKRPFLFLTSQTDSKNIEEAKKTLPSGYLSKPIQLETLKATIEITLQNFNSKTESAPTIRLMNGSTKYILKTNEISFIEAEHVYVKIFKKDGAHILHRSTLKGVLNKLPGDDFIQSHRSYVVNINHITSWDTNSLYIGKYKIPMSRRKKKDVLDLLQ